MTIVSCPKCHEQVAMPRGASPRATVRCPLCVEQFLLAEILDAFPPALEVVEDPEADSVDAIAEASGVGMGFQPVEEEDEEVGAAVPAFSIDRSADASTTTAVPRRRKGPVRTPRKKKNATVEVVKIVLGGIAGLLIAQLILWWMPWQNLRRDPFGLGPVVANYAPWLVPAKFHAKGGAGALPGAGGDSATGESTASGTTGLAESGFPQRTFVDPNDQGGPAAPAKPGPRKPATGNKRSAEPPESVTEMPEDPAKPDPTAVTAELPSTDETPALNDNLLDLGPEMTDTADLETNPGSGLESDPQPATATPEPSGGLTPEPAPEPSGTAVDTRQRLPAAPLVSGAELKEAVDQVRPVVEQLEQATTEDAVQLVVKNYRNLTRLCETVVLATDFEAKDREQSVSLLLSLAEKPDAVPMLGKAGAAWLTAGSRRANGGILLVGLVKGIAQEGGIFRTDLALSDGKTTAAVYGETDPATVYQKEDQVLVLGYVVEQPSDNLAGYTGQDPLVVWGPFARVVPE